MFENAVFKNYVRWSVLSVLPYRSGLSLMASKYTCTSRHESSPLKEEPVDKTNRDRGLPAVTELGAEILLQLCSFRAFGKIIETAFHFESQLQ